MSSSDVAPLPIGIILYGYRIDKVLGQGGFGVTYLGTKLETGKVFVIKENIPGVSARRAAGALNFTWADNAENADGTGSRKWSEDNFIREATRLTQLKHRGIVTATEAFRSQETGTAYYTMPYVSPNSLSHILRQNVNCTKEWVLYLLAALLDSLKYVHSKNVLHRDIKPENILMAPDGEPVIIDFGSARGADADHKTRIVSANYSPIEQMRGEGEGPWTDLYSLAASLYQVMTGEYVPQLACRGGKKDAYVPMATRPEMVNKYGALLMSSMDKALAFEPEDRYQSADEWMSALGGEPAFQFQTPVPPPVAKAPVPSAAPTVLLGDNIKLPKKQGGAGWIVGAAAALVLLLGGGAAWWYLQQQEQPSPVADAPSAALTDAKPAPQVQEEQPAEKPLEKTGTRALRIVARPDIKMYSKADKSPMDTDVPAFAVYYSHGEADGYYEVADRPESKTIGLLKKEDVYPWPFNLVIDFNSLGGVVKRDRSLFFNNPEHAKAFVTDRTKEERHDMALRAAEAAKGGNIGDLEEKHGVVAIEPQKWGGNYRLLPVLDYMKGDNGCIDEFPYNGADGDVSSSILKIAAMTANNVQTKAPGKTAAAAPAAPAAPEAATPVVDLVFVVDTTKSMGPYIDAVRDFIAAQAQELDTASKGRIRFGLVAYRDWKWDKDGMPDTALCGYVTKNYTSEVGHMMDIAEFRREVLEKREGNEYDLRETTIDSVDCAEDMFAGLFEAVASTPWRDKGKPAEEHNLRFVVLIGDAPCRDYGEQEANALRLSSPYWKNRATGSFCSLAKESLASLMKDNHVFLQSYFILTPAPNGIKDKTWISYLKHGIAQFQDLSYSDPNSASGKCCTVVAGNKFQEAGDNSAILGKLKVKAESNFQNAFSNTMTELSKLTGDGVDVQEEDGEASAAKSLFAGAYVEWFAKQKPNEDDKTDMEGWTQDTNDERSETMEAKIVLSRAQLEQEVQNIQNVINGITSQEDEELDEALNGVVAQMYTLVADPNIRQKKLGNGANTLIAALPFKSNLLQMVLNDSLSDASSKAELLKGLKARVAYMTARLGNEGSCIPDPKGDKKQDLFLIPVIMLP